MISGSIKRGMYYLPQTPKPIQQFTKHDLHVLFIKLLGLSCLCSSRFSPPVRIKPPLQLVMPIHLVARGVVPFVLKWLDDYLPAEAPLEWILQNNHSNIRGISQSFALALWLIAAVSAVFTERSADGINGIDWYIQASHREDTVRPGA